MRIALVLFLAAAAYALDITPYLPIGLQDGVFDNHGTGSTLSEAALEGPFRLDREGKPVMPAGRRTFHAPDFEVDLALLVTPSDAPDIDGDGKANDVDDDDDGHPDGEDAFPLEPEEWADADADLIGDVLDADDDGDGKGEDENGNDTPDHDEMDLDGDGGSRARSMGRVLLGPEGVARHRRRRDRRRGRRRRRRLERRRGGEGGHRPEGPPPLPDAVSPDGFGPVRSVRRSGR